jgi:hypothetical protein
MVALTVVEANAARQMELPSVLKPLRLPSDKKSLCGQLGHVPLKPV